MGGGRSDGFLPLPRPLWAVVVDSQEKKEEKVNKAPSPWLFLSYDVFSSFSGEEGLLCRPWKKRVLRNPKREGFSVESLYLFTRGTQV